MKYLNFKKENFQILTPDVDSGHNFLHNPTSTHQLSLWQFSSELSVAHSIKSRSRNFLNSPSYFVRSGRVNVKSGVSMNGEIWFCSCFEWKSIASSLRAFVTKLTFSSFAREIPRANFLSGMKILCNFMSH